MSTNDFDRAIDYLEENHERNSFLASLFTQWRTKGSLTTKQIEAVLRNIQRERENARGDINPVTEVGMYRNGANIYRVRWNQAGTALYALRFVPEATTKSERLVYEGGAIKRLSANDRLTIQEAEEVGALYGICCVCGAELTDSKSVQRGIGPVCAKKV
jgi:hypothetical protein